nr:ORF62 [Bracoviriform inaniti]
MDSKKRKLEYHADDMALGNSFSTLRTMTEIRKRLHDFILRSPAHDDIVKKLVNETWPVCLLDIRNNDGMTALHYAVMGNQSDIVRQLIVAGANPLAKDDSGCIPLHYACSFGIGNVIAPLTEAFNHQEITRMQSKNLTIPDLSISFQARNINGATPLHLAAQFGCVNVVKIFIEHKFI